MNKEISNKLNGIQLTYEKFLTSLKSRSGAVFPYFNHLDWMMDLSPLAESIDYMGKNQDFLFDISEKIDNSTEEKAQIENLLDIHINLLLDACNKFEKYSKQQFVLFDTNGQFHPSEISPQFAETYIHDFNRSEVYEWWLNDKYPNKTQEICPNRK